MIRLKALCSHCSDIVASAAPLPLPAPVREPETDDMQPVSLLFTREEVNRDVVIAGTASIKRGSSL